MSILKSCRCETKNIADQKHVNPLNRGGLTRTSIVF